MWHKSECVMRWMFDWTGLQLCPNWRNDILISCVLPELAVVIYRKVKTVLVRQLRTTSNTRNKEVLVSFLLVEAEATSPWQRKKRVLCLEMEKKKQNGILNKAEVKTPGNRVFAGHGHLQYAAACRNGGHVL